MSLAAPTLHYELNVTTSATSKTSTSFTPTAGRWLFVHATCRDVAGAVNPTLSISNTHAGAWSWNEIKIRNGFNACYLFYAWVPASPGAGTVTVDAGATSCNRWRIIIHDVGGTASQTITNTKVGGPLSVSNPHVTLNTTPSTRSYIITTVMNAGATSACTPDDTQIAQESGNTTGLLAEYRTGSTSTSCGATGCGTTSNIVLAIEVPVNDYTTAVDAASFALTGVSNVLSTSVPVTKGTFVLTGSAAALQATRRMTAAVASFVLTGVSNVLSTSVPVTTGAFVLTGTAAALQATRKLSATVATFALTGPATGLAKGFRTTGDLGTFTETGVAVSLRTARSLTAATETFSLTGTATGVAFGHQLLAAVQSYALTGVPNVLSATIPASASVFAVSGFPVGLTRARTLAAATGAFTETGVAVGTHLGWLLTTGTGAYDLTGRATGLLFSRGFPAVSGSFLLTGRAALFARTQTLSGASGAIILTGVAPGLIVGRSVVAGVRAFALAGPAVSLRRLSRLVVARGTFVLTGRVTPIHRSNFLRTAEALFHLHGNAVVWGEPGTDMIAVIEGTIQPDVDGTVSLKLYSKTASQITVKIPTIGVMFDAGSTAKPITRGSQSAPRAGVFHLTGKAVALRVPHRLAADTGVFIETGRPAGVGVRQAVLGAARGLFASTGVAAGLHVVRRMSVPVTLFAVVGTGIGSTRLLSPGAFALTGKTTGFKATRRMATSSRAFVLTGKNNTLSKNATAPFVVVVPTIGLSRPEADIIVPVANPNTGNNFTIPPNKTADFRGRVFRMHQKSGDYKASRIAAMNCGNNVVFVGAKILGVQPFDLTWYQMKHDAFNADMGVPGWLDAPGNLDSNSANHRSGDNLIVFENFYIRNGQDPFNIGGLDGGPATYRGCYVDWSRDDAIENDGLKGPLRVEDCLVYTHEFLSMRNAGGGNGVVPVFRNSLIRCRRMPRTTSVGRVPTDWDRPWSKYVNDWPDQTLMTPSQTDALGWTAGGLWKMSGVNSNSIDAKDCVFCSEGLPPGAGLDGWPPGIYVNCKFIWLGPLTGDGSMSAAMAHLPHGVTLSTDPEDWNREAVAWIEAHGGTPLFDASDRPYADHFPFLDTVLLPRSVTLSAVTGTMALTGLPVSLTTTHPPELAAETGAVVLTGSAASLTRSHPQVTLSAVTRAFVLAGKAVTLTRSHTHITLSTVKRAFVLTGEAVTLTVVKVAVIVPGPLLRGVRVDRADRTAANTSGRKNDIEDWNTHLLQGNFDCGLAGVFIKHATINDIFSVLDKATSNGGDGTRSLMKNLSLWDGVVSISMPMGVGNSPQTQRFQRITGDASNSPGNNGTGIYDTEYKDFFNRLKTLFGRGGNVIIRLAWEAAGSGFPHQINWDFDFSDPANNDFSNWIRCFKYMVNMAKDYMPDCRIDLTNHRDPSVNNLPGDPDVSYAIHPEDYYPGDGFVDMIGVPWYDAPNGGVTWDGRGTSVSEADFMASTNGISVISSKPRPRGPHRHFLDMKHHGKIWTGGEGGSRVILAGQDRADWFEILWAYCRTDIADGGWKGRTPFLWNFNDADSQLWPAVDTVKSPAQPRATASYKATFGSKPAPAPHAITKVLV